MQLERGYGYFDFVWWTVIGSSLYKMFICFTLLIKVGSAENFPLRPLEASVYCTDVFHCLGFRLLWQRQDLNKPRLWQSSIGLVIGFQYPMRKLGLPFWKVGEKLFLIVIQNGTILLETTNCYIAFMINSLLVSSNILCEFGFFMVL